MDYLHASNDKFPSVLLVGGVIDRLLDQQKFGAGFLNQVLNCLYNLHTNDPFIMIFV
jgi:hypothetical protein